jgi:hypothetical protein
MKIKSKQMPSLNEGKIYIGDSSNNATNSAYTLPTSDGSANQVLTTDGSGAVTFQDASGGGGISNLVEDTTPQLGGTLNLNSKTIQGNFTPSASNTYKLGTTSSQWSDLYLGDGGVIYFGNDSDTMLYHQNDTGLRLELISSSESGYEPKFELIARQSSSSSGPNLIFNHEGSDANNDILGALHFKGDSSTSNGQIYSYITSTIIERDHASRTGKLSFYVISKASYRTAIEISGNSSSTAATTSLKDYVNIVDHNGTTGLKLADTLVTSTAAELNILDGDTSETPTTLVDADRVVVNDAGTMKQVAFSDVMTYVNANVSSGGGGFTYSRVTSDVATASISTHYSVDASSNNVTITLPALSAVTKGQEIRFKLYDQSSSYKLIIAPATNEKIDSSTSNYELTIKNQAVTLVASDDNAGHDSWEII